MLERRIVTNKTEENKESRVKFFKCIILPLVGSFAISSIGLAHNFSKEDRLFANRGSGFEASTRAREAYAKTLNSSLNESDKKYAVSQMARLDIYRGAMLPNIRLKDRKNVLEQCLDTVDKIRSTGSQEYYYYHLACIGFRGKLSSTMGRIKWALKLKKAQGAALKSVRSGIAYEGGGILRVLSAVRGNRKAKPLGLYKPEEALKFSTQALNTPRTKVKPFPTPLAGSDYHENYYYIGQSQVALALEKNNMELAKKSLVTLTTALQRLDDLEDMDELPAGREPETAYYKGLMTVMSKNIMTCLSSGSSWRSCLIKKLN